VELLAGRVPRGHRAVDSDRNFRLCHCDVDVYQSAKDVFDWVWPRLAPGGVIVFDDYGFPACPGVTKFVDEQRLLDDRLVVHNLNGHGIVVKR
jgi:O-methyltransferase